MKIHKHKFELWPGYITSIRQHESDLLMCAEITHKVMRQENLLEILNRLKEERRGGDFQVIYFLNLLKEYTTFSSINFSFILLFQFYFYSNLIISV